MKSEIVMWCIYDGAYHDPYSVKFTRTSCIQSYIKDSHLTWRQLCKKYNISCQKIKITIEQIP